MHIIDLQPGMQVRIALKGGFHMIPRISKNGNYLAHGDKRSRRRGYEKSVLAGTVTANDPPTGQFSMNVSEEVYGQVYKADVPYRFIGIAQLIVSITELVETATRPGAVALGTKLVGGQLLNPRYRLVRIDV